METTISLNDQQAALIYDAMMDVIDDENSATTYRTVAQQIINKFDENE